MTDRIRSITKKFSSHDDGQRLSAIDEIAALQDLAQDEKVELASALASVFFNEDATHPLAEGLVQKAESSMASLGVDIADWIIQQLSETDAESAKHFGHALGLIGADAVDKVVAAFDTYGNDHYATANILLAASSFTDAAILKALPKILEFCGASSAQTGAEAVEALGRIAMRISYGAVTAKDRAAMFDKAFEALSNTSALVRRHGVKSLGKMVRCSYLDDAQVDKSFKAFRAILGYDNFEWDSAYIVRHEAEAQLHFCTHGGKGGNGAMSNYKQDFKVVEKRELCPNTFYFRVNAPLLAKKIQAGQFIIMRPNSHSERIPLSIAGWDRDKGYIEVIIMAAGRTSTEAVNKNVGDCFQDIVGPLGQRSHVAKYDGVCVVIGGGYGTGAVIPTARDLKALGNKVYGIVGARNKDLLIMVDELRGACDEVITTTNDGSDGIEGFVTHGLEKIMEKEKVSTILAVGPVPMMMAVAKMTEGKGIETWVSLNAIMVDGTGMCGACRVTVDGKTKFACFHGPDFNGHKVDFSELTKRQKMFVDKEKIAFEALSK